MGRMVKRGHLGGNIRTGDPETHEPRLWKWLIKRYHVRAMLDVGCGRGHTVRFFRRHGVTALGVDGLWANAWKEKQPIIVHDYCDGPFRISNLDLVWCCELVEHVEEKYLPNILQTFKGAKIVAMTYGVGAGYHHVNVQDEDYWIDRVSTAGFKLLRDGTRKARLVAEHRFFREHGLLFQRRW